MPRAQVGPEMPAYVFPDEASKDDFVRFVDETRGYPNEDADSYPAVRRKWGTDTWGVARDEVVDECALAYGKPLAEGKIDGTWNPSSPF